MLPTNECATEIIYEPVPIPDKLIQINTIHAEPETFGDSVDLALVALGALGECNADKVKLQEISNVKTR
mgnify:CR=1 FL=1